MSVPPTKFRGRADRVTYVYDDDPDHPDRVTGHIATPEWTIEDQGLMLALEAYEDTLCPGCGQPKQLAWHSHTEDEWDSTRLVCHACTAQQGKETVYAFPSLFLSDDRVAALPPLDFDKYITEPTERPETGADD